MMLYHVMCYEISNLHLIMFFQITGINPKICFKRINTMNNIKCKMYERDSEINNQIIYNVIKQMINVRLLLRAPYVLLTNYITHLKTATASDVLNIIEKNVREKIQNKLEFTTFSRRCCAGRRHKYRHYRFPDSPHLEDSHDDPR